MNYDEAFDHELKLNERLQVAAWLTAWRDLGQVIARDHLLGLVAAAVDAVLVADDVDEACEGCSSTPSYDEVCDLHAALTVLAAWRDFEDHRAWKTTGARILRDGFRLRPDIQGSAYNGDGGL